MNATLLDPLVWMILAPVLLLVALSLIPLLSRPNERTDPEFWRGGIFYVNPDDPALFVPKRIGIGYTLNFGNRFSWLVLALILIIALLPVVIAIQNVGRLSKLH